MDKDKKLLVLYSWEGNERTAIKWATALCLELNRYEHAEATCDMLWHPHSNIKQEIHQKMQDADNILVIVTKSYNEKIQTHSGMVSYEEEIYREIVEKSEKKNKILFLLKESDIALPQGWEDYNRIDISLFCLNRYYQTKSRERKKKLDEIIRFCFNIPEYEIPHIKDIKMPVANKVKSFAEWYSESIRNQARRDEKKLTFKQQESRLLEFVKLNASQLNFVDLYIRAGLSADTNLSGRMTPQLFSEYFLVKRTDKEEIKYNAVINELFSSPNYNCLCIQSDGGSGKSTFIQTMSCRRAARAKEYFNNVIFDLSNLTENDNTKEDLLFQRVRKEYTRMSKGSGSYYDAWKEVFRRRIDELRDVSFSDARLYRVNNLQTNLQESLSYLIPDKLDDWYFGYSERISHSKNVGHGTLFTILMIIYLIILDSKPELDKPEKSIIVFDNIETYDNGRTAQRISNYIETCYNYVKHIFIELGIGDDFCTKFTFVVVLRTSTLIPFSNLQTDMWGAGRFVEKIDYFDFTEEALLKKLKFLEKIPNYRKTILFNMLYTIVSIMLPTNKIDEYLKTGVLTESHYRQFTTKRILPLFNNNYRRTMRNLYDSIINEDRNPTIYSMITELNGLQGAVYDYSVNGIRMALIRDIFDRLYIHNYFSEIGFQDLSGTEKYSMTRMILGYLYWDEVRDVVYNAKSSYVGVEISKIADTFKYFCGYDKIVKILYGLSVYSNKNDKKGAALNEWGNLLIFDKLEVDLTEIEFEDAIKRYLSNGSVEIRINDIILNLNRVTVRLSDAGMCFVQYYIRSFEFLMSRSINGYNYSALFLMNNDDEIIESMDNIYEIISNCIGKLMGGCEHMCVLYGKEKKECIYCQKFNKKNNLNILSCSLFIRYQECLDMVREAIDYIDRYRIILYRKSNDAEINKRILGQIKKYYGLYDQIKQAIMVSTYTEKLLEFIKNWEYPNNVKLNELISEKIKNSQKIKRNRPIQAYYTRDDENIEKAIKYAEENPLNRIYEIIQMQLNNSTEVEENAD